MKTTTNRLDTISTRQRGSRVRDVFFAACVVLATAVSITTVSTAAHAASTSQVAHR
jgi:hypothetical protein